MRKGIFVPSPPYFDMDIKTGITPEYLAISSSHPPAYSYARKFERMPSSILSLINHVSYFGVRGHRGDYLDWVKISRHSLLVDAGWADIGDGFFFIFNSFNLFNSFNSFGLNLEKWR